MRIFSLYINGNLGKLAFVCVHEELEFSEHPNCFPLFAIDLGDVGVEFFEGGLNIRHSLAPLIEASECFVLELHVVKLFLKAGPVFSEVLDGNIHLFGTFLVLTL